MPYFGGAAPRSSGKTEPGPARWLRSDPSLAFLRRAAKSLHRAGVLSASWQHPEFGAVSVTVAERAAAPARVRAAKESDRDRIARAAAQREAEVYGVPPGGLL